MGKLLGIVHLEAYQKIHAYNDIKPEETKFSTPKVGKNIIGTDDEIPQFPSANVVFNRKSVIEDQYNESIYVHKDLKVETVKVKKPPTNIKFKVEKSISIKPQLENHSEVLDGDDCKNTIIQDSMQECFKTDLSLCNVCSKTFATHGNLKAHLKTHDIDRPDQKCICNICSKTLSNKLILKSHMKLHNPESGRYKPDHTVCTICSTSTSSKFAYAKHMAKKHGDKERALCTNCSNSFSMVYMFRHEKLCNMSEDEKHEEKKKYKVECPDCGRVLGSRTKLRRHIRFIHKKEKLFRCNHCEHEDYRKDNMKVHVKNSHREVNLDESISNIQNV